MLAKVNSQGKAVEYMGSMCCIKYIIHSITERKYYAVISQGFRIQILRKDFEELVKVFKIIKQKL